jgi:hypothetical protein
VDAPVGAVSACAVLVACMHLLAAVGLTGDATMTARATLITRKLGRGSELARVLALDLAERRG